MFPASGEAGVYTIQHQQYNGNTSPHASHDAGIQQAQDPRNGHMASGMHPPPPHGFVGATSASTASLAASSQSKYSVEASTPAASDAEMLLGLSVEQQRQQQKATSVHHSPMDGLIMGGGGGYNNDEAGSAMGAYNAYNIMIETEDINMNSMGVNHLLPFLEFVPYDSYQYGTEAGDGLVNDHHHHHHR